ncbi:MAG: PilZ domain-containing protein [Candidatus Omnitrophota bacterium]|jgi:c-di-GMP-binding flagellar brake protein YcgR
METRLKHRYDIKFTLDCRIEESNQQQIKLTCGDHFEGVATDISEGGLGFFSKYFLPKGLVMKLTIDAKVFGFKKDMVIEGEITHCKNLYGKIEDGLKYKCGLKFRSIAEEDRQEIGRFISEHEQRKTPRLGL